MSDPRDVDIVGLDKAEVLRALYNNALPKGLGAWHYDGQDMPIEEARALLEEAGPQLYFDYVKGRVLKVGLRYDDVFMGLYDRDNGGGEGARVIAELRARLAEGVAS